MLIYVKIIEQNLKYFLIYVNFMLIYVQKFIYGQPKTIVRNLTKVK
jgi:hypothetical protein